MKLSASSPSDSALAILRFIRSAQLHNRFVVGGAGTDLTLAETHFLIELDGRPGLTLTEMAENLMLSKVAVTRIAQALVKIKVLSISANADDLRRKDLKLTAAGKKLAAKLDANFNPSTERLCRQLNAEELVRFRRYHRILADGFGVKRSPLRPQEHPLRPDMRMVTRALGMLKESDFVKGELSSIEWHLLMALRDAGEPLNISALCEIFCAPTATISGVVARLSKGQMVKRGKGAGDQRMCLVHATAKGLDLLRASEEVDAGRIRRALAELNSEEIADLVRLFEKFSGSAENSAIVLQPELSTRVMNPGAERALAREMAVMTYSAAGRLLDLPETLYGRDSFCFGLFLESTLLAAVEYQPRAKLWEICNQVRRPEVTVQQLKSFWAAAAKAFSQFAPGAKAVAI